MKQTHSTSAWKEKLRPWLRALTNPHLLVSLGIAWFLTNGWAYCAVGFGWYFDIHWMLNAGTVWLGILWMPGTPEKLVTFALAMGILRLMFPYDTRTLAMVYRKRREWIARTKMGWQKFRTWLRHK